VLGSCREPFGGTDLLLVALPIDRVEPTPYGRMPPTHVKRLMGVVELRRFLDPIIAVRHEGGWTRTGTTGCRR
jgi:ParB family chromosome partitioning protein